MECERMLGLLEIHHSGKPAALARKYQARMLALSRGTEYNTADEIKMLTNAMFNEKLGNAVLDTSDSGLQSIGFARVETEQGT